MNWNHFLLLLCGIYIVYYALNILLDMLRYKRVPRADAGQDLLFFSEETEPELITPEESIAEEKVIDPPEVTKAIAGKAAALPESTGAVLLKDLFRLAQQDLIEYTKAIPYP